MQLILHCGFPKTGTTALQRWFAANQNRLLDSGIAYPFDFRDDEGIAHHLLNHLASQGFERIADNIILAARGLQCGKLFLSAEGLSNILGKEDESGLSFFTDLSNRLNSSGMKTSFLFTLRKVDRYVRSIIIQNILYDGLSDTPSAFASHTLSTLARAYGTLSDLLRLGSIKLFEYSGNIYQSIIEHVIDCPLSAFDKDVSMHFEHTSPSEQIVQFFIWLNYTLKKIPPDFHSYVRFHPTSQKVLSHCDCLLSETAMSMDCFAASWEPSAELLDSSLRFFNMAWVKSLSYKSRDELSAQGAEYLLLRKHLGADIPALITHHLVKLDYMHYKASDPSLAPFYAEALDRLIEQGSQEYGQDFRTQVDQSRIINQPYNEHLCLQ
jgi:hypothetical protein